MGCECAPDGGQSFGLRCHRGGRRHTVPLRRHYAGDTACRCVNADCAVPLAACAEAWQAGRLVGGLYGLMLGRVFFGESMFSLVSNASKFAFINWTETLQQQGVVMIDCQVHTGHLESLGARMIRRADFIEILDGNIAS